MFNLRLEFFPRRLQFTRHRYHVFRFADYLLAFCGVIFGDRGDIDGRQLIPFKKNLLQELETLSEHGQACSSLEEPLVLIVLLLVR